MSHPISDPIGVRIGVPDRTPTNERTNGRTNEESLSPTRDNPDCFVTRTRAYGDVSLADFEAKQLKPCPICSRLMQAKYSINRARGYCSLSCASTGRAAASVQLNAEVDEMAVVRLLDGSKVLSTRGERIEAVRVLTERGRSASFIADLLHTTRRSIERYRAELTNRKQAVA